VHGIADIQSHDTRDDKFRVGSLDSYLRGKESSKGHYSVELKRRSAHG
jgi:hypothetical protein